jgi:hypothetical protein
MASFNEISADPDVHELSQHAARARHTSAGSTIPSDVLHQPAKPDDFVINHLDASDLLDDLTESFDDEIGMPRQ